MKTRIVLTLAALAMPLNAQAVRKSAPPAAADRAVEPTQRVGAITPATTEKDVLRVYGASNVARSINGAYATVYPGTPDEILLEFRGPGRTVARVCIGGAGGAWATAAGLRVGTALADLQKMNGVPFDITGVNWEIPARVVSWNGGAFPPQMYVDLAPNGGEMDERTRKRLTSQKAFFDSGNPLLQRFSVSRIILEW